MNDFMVWLYDNYIKEQVERQPMDDGETFHADLLDGVTTEKEKADLAVVVRFYAAHAFLLGVRTGIGLYPLLDTAPGGPVRPAL